MGYNPEQIDTEYYTIFEDGSLYIPYEGFAAIHRFWYMIHGLENKYSRAAEKRKENYIADFYSLSDKILSYLVQQYSNFLNSNYYDLKWIVEQAEDGDEDAKQELVKFSVKRLTEDKELVAGISMRLRILQGPRGPDGKGIKISVLAKVYENTLSMLSLLKDAQLSNSVDKRMTAISLALNLGHASMESETPWYGSIFEIAVYQLQSLSDLFTGPWDEELAKFT